MSMVVSVQFPDNADVRTRSIVLRAGQSAAGELTSKIMAKCGLRGVGELYVRLDEKDVLLRKEDDVYAIVEENPAAILLFRGSAVTDSQIVETVDTRPVVSVSPRGRLPSTPSVSAAASSPAKNTTFSSSFDTTATTQASTTTSSLPGQPSQQDLLRKISEQERIIDSLRQEIQSLKMIEKEQLKIIDAQAGSRSALKGDMEIDRLRVALDQEKQQHAYDIKELETLRQQKAEYLKKLRQAGHRAPEDDPENAAGCNTNPAQCVMQ